MKTFQLLFALVPFFTASFAFAHPFDPYLGCFETLTVDGVPPKVEGDLVPFSYSMEAPRALFLKDVSGAEIPTIEFHLFEYSEVANDAVVFVSREYAPIFLDRGTATGTDNSAEYSFEDWLMNRQLEKIHPKLKTTITRLSPAGPDEQFEIHVIRELGNPSDWVDKRFVLKRIQCG